MRKDKKKDNIDLAKLSQLERMEYEAMNAEVESTLEKYLPYVFRDEHFVVGVDTTGCYLFAENGSDQDITAWAEELMDDLLLKSDEICLCVVGRESKYNYCSKKLLGKYASKAVRVRKPVFTNRDIKEILGAYGISLENKSFYADYSETKLFKEVQNVVGSHGWKLEEEIINKICYLKPEDFQSLKDLGVPDAVLAEVLNCVGKADGGQPLELAEQKKFNSLDDNFILKPRHTKKYLLMFLAMAGLIILVLGLCCLVWDNKVVQDVLQGLHLPI